MDQKRRLFIYDRKEVGVLILLGVGVALFAFTLGVHLGKQVVPKTVEIASEAKSTEPVEGAAEQAPNRNEIAKEVKNIPAAVDETLDQSLRDEIAKTGLQVDKGRQVELPEKIKTPKKVEIGSPEVGSESSAAATPVLKTTSRPASSSAMPARGRYTLQVGSFPSLRDAEPELLKLNENGLRAQVREVELAGKGKWYRLFVGQFDSIKDADKAGKTFRQERRISDFVVVRAPEAGSTKTE